MWFRHLSKACSSDVRRTISWRVAALRSAIASTPGSASIRREIITEQLSPELRAFFRVLLIKGFPSEDSGFGDLLVELIVIFLDDALEDIVLGDAVIGEKGFELMIPYDRL